MNNTFEKVCIVGLGLIGGSIGLAIKRSNISNQITGYARSNSTLERAIELGLVDSVKDNLKDAVNNSDLVILATPLSTFRELVEEMSPFLKKGCIITDTGSAKLTGLRCSTTTLIFTNAGIVPAFFVAWRYNGNHAR